MTIFPRLSHRTWMILSLVILLAPLLTGPVLLGQSRSSNAQIPLSPPDDQDVQGEGPWVVRAYFTDRQMVNDLATWTEPWEVHHDLGYLVVDVNRAGYDRLLAAGFWIEIDEQLTDQLNQPNVRLPNQITGIPGYLCYRTVEETFATAQAIVAAHPDLAAWIDIGDSWEKIQLGGNPGYDMMVLRLTNSAIPGPKPKLFVMTAVHAREYTTAELNTRFAEYLIDNYGTDPDVTWLLDHHEMHLLLQSNPDGRKKAETGLSWRKNTNENYCSSTSNNRGADLNRNFEFQWGCCGGSSGSECYETYRGPSPASEPETQAIQNYVRSQFPDQREDLLNAAAPITATGIFLDVHSYSELVLWPWGFTSALSPNAVALQTLGRKFAYFNGYWPEQAVGLYPTDGTTDDFGYGELGLAAYTFELGTTFFQNCNTFENTILPDNLPALLYAAKVVRTPYLTPSGPDALNLAVLPAGVNVGETAQLAAIINDTRYENSNGTEPTQHIVAAEYYIDTPPWVTTTVPIAYPMAAADGAFDETIETVSATIDTVGQSPGRHTIFVRGQDADGNWGPFTAVFLSITAAPDSAIAGVVHDDATGVPIDQAEVGLLGGSFDQFATTGPDGAFHFDVYSDTYTRTAIAYGYHPVTATNVIAVTGVTTTQTISLTAFSMGTLVGQVTQTRTGLALEAAISAASDYATFETSSDPATGFYSVTVFSDTYTITAQAGGHASATFNDVTVTQEQTTTQDFVLHPQCCALLVDDDDGQSYESYFQIGLERSGIHYQTWEVASQGSPTADDLGFYTAVLWFTGDDSAFDTLTAQDRANLSAYLNGGGNLFLTGTEIGAGNLSFWAEMLYSQFVSDDSGVNELVGSGIFDGLGFSITGGDGANNQDFPDTLLPIAPATRVFTYAGGFELGGGVAVDTGTYRAINLGFGVEGVDNVADRTAIVRDGLAWLGCPAPPVQLQLDKTATPEQVFSGNLLTYTLTFTNNSTISTTHVVITDVLPDRTTFAWASDSGAITGGVVAWNLPLVPPHETLSLTLVVTVTGVPSGSAAFPLVNAVYGVRSDQSPSPTRGWPVTVIVHSPLSAGTLAGRITQANTGLPLAATVSVVSGDLVLETTSDPSTGLYSLMIPSDTYTLTAQADGYASGTVTDVTVPQGQTTTQDLILQPHIQLQLGKTVTPAQVFPGDLLTYTLTLTNNSIISVTNVVITDVLPAHTAFARSSNGGVITNSVVSWNAPVVPAYSVLSRTLLVTVSDTFTGTFQPPGTLAFLVNAVYGVRSDQSPSLVWGRPVSVIVHSPVSNFVYLPVILRGAGG
ncbi:MAG: DUF11 domain-containing protein [Chloroflexi bacterium]|nr:DUF11 domain-containing protein [Chloroflexota bacterium]